MISQRGQDAESRNLATIPLQDDREHVRAGGQRPQGGGGRQRQQAAPDRLPQLLLPGQAGGAGRPGTDGVRGPRAGDRRRRGAQEQAPPHLRPLQDDGMSFYSTYRGSHLLMGWVDFDFDCPAAQLLLPDSHQPRQN